MRYEHTELEPKWQKVWEAEGLYQADDTDATRETRYVLDMFPYPSGAGLHVGHPEGYTATDIVSRKWRMQGYNVLHPMGWDAFGLPAENYAIKTGVHPAVSTEKNIETFTRQIKSLGFSYDWTREVATCRPDYYRWTQWWFSFLYKQGLAYRREAPVNWCDSCQTVLANEQVVDGKCERCGSTVRQRNMRQWFFKITDFIEDTRAEDTTPRRFVLLHGWEGKPTSNFFPWLKGELEQRGYEVVTPELPNAAHPVPEEWLAAIDALGLDEHTVVIGHSLGATAITRWLERRRKKLYKVILVGGTTQYPGKNPETAAFKQLPLTTAVHNLAEFESLYSPGDTFVAPEDSAELSRLIGVPAWEIAGKGHFQVSECAEVLLAATTRLTRGLISGLEKIDWPESTKTAQRNWIGRSEGAEVDFQLEGREEKITVFTTRVDTLYSGAFVVIAPEHPLVGSVTTPENKAAVEVYVANKKTDLERQTQKEKTGVFTGSYVTNPINGKRLPVWIGDFVLGHYGTGAVFGDAHDERDFEFGKKYGIPLTISVLPTDEALHAAVRALDVCFTDDGILVDSEEFTGMASAQARKAITTKLETLGNGKRRVTYRLRDWLVSRQRYWGSPIPIVYDAEGGEHLVEDSQLPVTLPTDVDYQPKGMSPLESSQTFHAGLPEGYRRECDTMDTFVCSSWYFFRFADPKNAGEFASKELLSKWSPVDLYVGGAEHTVLHLLYARFFTKVAHKNFLIPRDEPFLMLRHQGMILGENNEKMSKSKGNVVNPDDIVREFGADTLRIYEMFMGPFADAVPWNTQGVLGVRRFLDKVLRLYDKVTEAPGSDAFLKALNKTVLKVSTDIDEFHFNTAVSAMMIFVNACEEEKELPKDGMATFARLIAPFAPHLAEELWREKLGNGASVHLSTWPIAEERYLVDDTTTYAVQVDGKLRDTLTLPAGLDKEGVLTAVKTSENVQKWLAGKELAREIVIPGKMVSLVTRP